MKSVGLILMAGEMSTAALMEVTVREMSSANDSLRAVAAAWAELTRRGIVLPNDATQSLARSMDEFLAALRSHSE